MMKEITKRMAEYLFNTNKEVFLLYTDGTESVAENIKDINEHKSEFFGVE